VLNSSNEFHSLEIKNMEDVLATGLANNKSNKARRLRARLCTPRPDACYGSPIQTFRTENKLTNKIRIFNISFPSKLVTYPLPAQLFGHLQTSSHSPPASDPKTSTPTEESRTRTERANQPLTYEPPLRAQLLEHLQTSSLSQPSCVRSQNKHTNGRKCNKNKTSQTAAHL
jgi:hypothetical protein